MWSRIPFTAFQGYFRAGWKQQLVSTLVNTFYPFVKSSTSAKEAFHNSRFWMASWICRSWSSTILRCCKDIDSIMLYLLPEKRPNVLMVLYHIHRTSQQVLKILNGQNIIKELRRHGDEQVDIATLMVLAPGNGAKQAHGCNAKLLLQFG